MSICFENDLFPMHTINVLGLCMAKNVLIDLIAYGEKMKNLARESEILNVRQTFSCLVKRIFGKKGHRRK